MSLVSYTKYKSTESLTKSYGVEDGAIKKKAAATMYKGTGCRVTIPFADFRSELAKQTNEEAFGYGLHPASYPDTVNIVVKGKESEENNCISRSLDYLQYRGPGIVMIDHDPNLYGNTYTADELLAALISVHSEIAQAARVVRGSVSAGVHLSGESPRTDKGFHLYMPVANTTLLKDYGALLADRLWLAGHGFIALSAIGGLLERTCIDGAVFSPERLDFVGKPIISGEGVAYTAPEIIYADGGMLDISTLSALTSEEAAQVTALKIAAKEIIKPVAEKQTTRWKNTKVKAMVKSGTSKEQATTVINQILSGSRQDLYADFLLEFVSGTVTVKEVLVNPGRYDDQSLADPVEGVAYGSTTAKFYWNNGKPVINSFAHGECMYFLHDSIAELSLTQHSIVSDTPDWKVDLEIHVQKMNLTHVSTLAGGKHKILRFEDAISSHNDRGYYALYNKKDLEQLHANTSIQVSEDKKGVPVYKNHLTAWATHPKALSFKGGMVFVPDKKVPDNYFNRWRGFSVLPMCNEALLDRIYYHMKEVVCAGHEDLYQYLLCWIAYTIQHPDKPAGAALVLRGDKGCGKGTLGHFLEWLWGFHGLYIANAHHLVGKFNGHLNDICFLFADEAFFSGDKQHEGVLKALITEPTLLIERKGIDSIQQPNYLKVFMATNSTFAVPASRDERRYCVFDVASTYIGNTDYFNALHADCKSKEVQAAFLHTMQSIDLAGWHTGMIPDSIGLREQRYCSMDSVQKWIVDVLLNERWAGVTGCTDDDFDEDWVEVLTSETLYKYYVNWCDKMKASEYKRSNQTQVSKYLGKVFESRRDIGGRGRRGYFFGNVCDAKAKFEAYEKIMLNELIADS